MQQKSNVKAMEEPKIRIVGKPFSKGVSGNPEGKKKGVPNIKTVLKRVLQIELLLTNPLTDVEEHTTPMDAIACRLVANAIRGDIASIKEVYERLEGKSQSNVSLEAEVKNQIIRIGFKNPDELSQVGDEDEETEE